MAENIEKSFGSSKWTKKRRNKRLATEDVDNILKEAETKKARSTQMPIKNENNTPRLSLSDTTTQDYTLNDIQVRIECVWPLRTIINFDLNHISNG